MIIKEIMTKDKKLATLRQDKQTVYITIYNLSYYCNGVEYSIHEKFPRTFTEVNEVYQQVTGTHRKIHLNTVLEGLVLLNKIQYAS